ncbi:AMP-binding protein [Streptomyces phyllanthi]|uniref:AMP-binding protein n=1 Tax=Streptomyces phyllanthi TaxID=1803180 RepID=UPI002AD4CD8C|nr:AMP-binding protein [Streptomyces phyllanthi]
MSYSNDDHGPLGRAGVVLRSLKVLHQSGLIRPSRPDQLVRSGRAIRTLGVAAGPVWAGARKDGDALCLVDELGELTFHQMDRRTNALARSLAERGIGPDSLVALLARDHRGAVETMVAAGKLGARLMPMNTGFAGPQLAEVAAREGVDALVYDEEFSETLAAARLPETVRRFLAWTDGERSGEGSAVPTLEQLIRDADDRPLPPPARPGPLVMLTSGTGGTPKAAPRAVGNPLAVAQLLDRIPLRAGECTVIGAPLFHGTGLSQFIMTLSLGSTGVVRRRFDPEALLGQIERYRATTLVLVPTMLHRILDLDRKVLDSYDTSSLRIILVAGAPLTPELGNRATEVFGDVIHNMYGSTEVSVATVALPEDWKAAPGTVGRPPVGSRIALFDREGQQITEPGVTGRIFVESVLAFKGYTDGRTRETIGSMLGCGDLGHLDAEGRLFIDGREDDMIVSGGENVYPAEIENLLADHEAIREAAVIGVPDEEFGQRLKVYVVPVEGASLDEDGVRSYVKARLARHKVPRDVVFLGELPRNSTGKLARNRLL